MRDYSQRCATGKSKRTYSGSVGSGKKRRLQKVIGVLMVLIMVIGISFSLWMSGEIRESLHELAKDKKKQEELTALQVTLLATRDNLMDREKIEVAAMRRGLFRPTAGQIFRP